jgi:hypothetical protein
MKKYSLLLLVTLVCCTRTGSQLPSTIDNIWLSATSYFKEYLHAQRTNTSFSKKKHSMGNYKYQSLERQYSGDLVYMEFLNAMKAVTEHEVELGKKKPNKENLDALKQQARTAFAQLWNHRKSADSKIRKQFNKLCSKLEAHDYFYLDSIHWYINPDADRSQLLAIKPGNFRYQPILEDTRNKLESSMDKKLVEVLALYTSGLNRNVSVESMREAEAGILGSHANSIQAWAENNGLKVPYRMLEIMRALAKRKKVECTELRELLEFYNTMSRSSEPIDRITIKHYKGYYSINFNYLTEWAEATNCINTNGLRAHEYLDAQYWNSSSRLQWPNRNGRLPVPATKDNQNDCVDPKDEKLMSALMLYSDFLTDSILMSNPDFSTDSIETLVEEIQIEEEKILGGDKKSMPIWVENNYRMLPYKMLGFMHSKSKNLGVSCSQIQKELAGYHKLQKSNRPFDKVMVSYYKSYYSIDFGYLKEWARSLGCVTIKNKETAIDSIIMDYYDWSKNVAGKVEPIGVNPIRNISAKDIASQDTEANRYRNKENDIIDAWKSKIHFLDNNLIFTIDDYKNYYENRYQNLPSPVAISGDVSHVKRYALDRKLVFLIFKHFDELADYTNEVDYSYLEEAYEEAQHLFTSVYPKDVKLQQHYKKYYGLDYSFVERVILLSDNDSLIKKMKFEGQEVHNQITRYKQLLNNGSQMKPIDTANVDFTKIGDVEERLIITLNDLLLFYNQDFSAISIYDFGLAVEEALAKSNRFRDTENNAKQDFVLSLYQLYKFYHYALMGDNANAEKNLVSSYAYLLEDFNSGHPLRKIRSKHYEKHLGITLKKLNEIAIVNERLLPKGGILNKAEKIVRRRTLYHPGNSLQGLGDYDEKHVYSALRQKWKLMDLIINGEYEYLSEIATLQDLLKKEHPTVLKWENSPEAVWKVNYKDLYDLTQGYEVYLNNMNDDTTLPNSKSLVCNYLKRALVKSGDSCEVYTFYSRDDFPKATNTESPTAPVSREFAFGMNRQQINDVLVSANCCKPNKIFVPQPITAHLSSFSVRESSNSSVTYSISIPRIVDRDISVEYVLGGTAQRELDYEIKGLAASGKLVIPARQTSASLQIKILDDKLADDDKKLAILLQKNTVINGMLNGSKSTLNIVDDEAELNKRIGILLKKFIEEGHQGTYIDIKELTQSDLPGHIKIQDFTNNMRGKYFKVSVNDFTRRILFEIGRYYIPDEETRGGRNANEGFENLNKAIEELRKVAIGIFEEYEKNQDGNDELYKILLLGGADAVPLGATDLVSPYTQRCYTHPEVVPYVKGKGYDFERLKKCTLGTNSYTTTTTGFKQCDHGTDQYCNADLPNLRLAFIKDIFSRYQEIEESRVVSLEGFVSPRIDPEHRNCTIILYVDPRIITE